MKESMDLRRCGSSGRAGEGAKFCAKDTVVYVRVTAASTKILETLTEPPRIQSYDWREYTAKVARTET